MRHRLMFFGGELEIERVWIEVKADVKTRHICLPARRADQRRNG